MPIMICGKGFDNKTARLKKTIQISEVFAKHEPNFSTSIHRHAQTSNLKPQTSNFEPLNSSTLPDFSHLYLRIFP